jgi:hypothetical protein
MFVVASTIRKIQNPNRCSSHHFPIKQKICQYYLQRQRQKQQLSSWQLDLTEPPWYAVLMTTAQHQLAMTAGSFIGFTKAKGKCVLTLCWFLFGLEILQEGMIWNGTLHSFTSN